MPSKKRNQPINKTPTLQIDAATFQVAVSAAVTVVMTHLNANNANVSGMVINNSNQSNNQVHQRVSNYHDTPNLKPKAINESYGIDFKCKSPQGMKKKRQQPMPTFTAMIYVTLTTIPTSIPATPIPNRPVSYTHLRAHET